MYNKQGIRKCKDTCGKVDLDYLFDGNYSYVGLFFTEVSGSSSQRTNCYNAN